MSCQIAVKQTIATRAFHWQDIPENEVVMNCLCTCMLSTKEKMASAALMSFGARLRSSGYSACTLSTGHFITCRACKALTTQESKQQCTCANKTANRNGLVAAMSSISASDVIRAARAACTNAFPKQGLAHDEGVLPQVGVCGPCESSQQQN